MYKKRLPFSQPKSGQWENRIKTLGPCFPGEGQRLVQHKYSRLSRAVRDAKEKGHSSFPEAPDTQQVSKSHTNVA